MSKAIVSLALITLWLGVLAPANADAQIASAGAAGRGHGAHDSHLGLHGFPFQQARIRRRASRLSPLRAAVRAQLFGPHQVRSELELEHALLEGREEAGELELEQAYLDFLLSRRFNVRAGMLLVPVGIINERHEPPTYYGVERPFVDTVIVPTTGSTLAPACSASSAKDGDTGRM